MATSKTEICNLALSHLGQDKEIADLDTENSSAARSCRRFYEEVRKKTLRDYDWPFATRISALSLKEEEPNDEWGYSYYYPADCLNARKILSGVRNDTETTKMPYEISHEDDGTVIFTDKEEAELKYTKDIEDVSRFPSDFVLALSYHLAYFIAPRLTAGDDRKLGVQAFQLYQQSIAEAQANATNEVNGDVRPESEFITGRE
jgi:hypothetical protein